MEGKPNKEQVMTTDLVDQELQLDDGGAALMLTVALHTRTAEAKRQLRSRTKTTTGQLTQK